VKLTGLLILMGISYGAQAMANLEKLSCSSGVPHERFEAVLDHGGFDEGSGYFDARNAYFQDNFLVVDEFVCSGSTLDSLKCIGFANRSPDTTLMVSLESKDGGIEAVYSTKSDIGESLLLGHWPCAVE
jgi:hypothetical protein